MGVISFYKSDSCEIGYLGPMALIRLKAAPTDEDFVQFEACIEMVLRTWPKIVRVMQMINGLPLPNMVQRARDNTARFKEQRLGVVVVIRPGLNTTIARRMLSTTLEPGDVQTTASVSEGISAANALLKTVGLGLTDADVAACVAFMSVLQ